MQVWELFHGGKVCHAKRIREFKTKVMSCNLWLETNLSLSIMHFWFSFSYLKTTSRATSTSTNSIQLQFLVVLHCTLYKVKRASHKIYQMSRYHKLSTCNLLHETENVSFCFHLHVMHVAWYISWTENSLVLKHITVLASTSGCFGIFDSMQSWMGKSESHSKNPCGLLHSP